MRDNPHDFDISELTNSDIDRMKGWGIERYINTAETHIGRIWIEVFMVWLKLNGYKIVKLDDDTDKS